MGIKTTGRLKEYFRKGAYPGEHEFGDLIDSFRHKNGEIAVSDVTGLSEALNNKCEATMAEELERQVQEINGQLNIVDNLVESIKETQTMVEAKAIESAELVNEIAAANGVEMGENGGVVAHFKGMAEGAYNVAQERTAHTVNDSCCDMVYDPDAGRFLLVYDTVGGGGEMVDPEATEALSFADESPGGGMASTATYYRKWEGMEMLCLGNGKPSGRKLYLHDGENSLWAMSEGTLRRVGDSELAVLRGELHDRIESADNQIEWLTEEAAELTDRAINAESRIEEAEISLEALKSEREQYKREFVGVWDEISSIKEILASIGSYELHGLLRQLEYTDEEISDYIYYNLNGFANITMDELRASAYKWTHRDEFTGVLQIAVMPHWQEEWAGDDFMISDIFVANTLKYLPSAAYNILKHEPLCYPYWFIAKCDASGESDIDDSECKNLYNIATLSGDFRKITIASVMKKLARLETTSDKLALSGKMFYQLGENNNPKDFSTLNEAMSKVDEIGGSLFRFSSIKNLQLGVGAWDVTLHCDDSSHTTFEGARITDSTIIIDNPTGIYKYDAFKTFKGMTIRNSTIGMLSGLANKTADCSYFGARNNILFEGEEICYVITPDSSHLSMMEVGSYFHQEHGIYMNPRQLPFTPVVVDCTNVKDIYTGDSRLKWVADAKWYAYNSYHVPCIFPKNIGYAESIANGIPIYKLFPFSVRYMEIFKEMIKTWADRQALGYSTVYVKMLEAQMEWLSDEDKALLTAKGYTLVKVEPT